MTRRLRQAAIWAARAEACEQDPTPFRFRRWLSDSANAAELERVTAARETAAALASDEELSTLRAEALQRAERRRSAANGSPYRAVAAAASLLLVTGVGKSFWRVGTGGGEPARQDVSGATFATSQGQRRALRLPDGSRLVLDTSTVARAAFSAGERRIVIERGQAFFEVARDRARPFVVQARGHRVVALGTQFNVRLDPDRLRVALVEGRVKVSSGNGGDVRLTPDQLLIATAAGASVRRDPAATLASTSWTVGRLTFRDTPLSDAVAEMNRYTTAPVILGDGRVGAIRISGSFRAGATEPFLHALVAGFPVTMRRLPDGRVMLAQDRP